MRDPAVQAVMALHLKPHEIGRVLNEQRIERRVWPPKPCRSAVVGLCAGGLVFGEALLIDPDHSTADGVVWRFETLTLYAQPLQHPASVHSRAMASPMPPAPPGTITAPRETRFEW